MKMDGVTARCTTVNIEMFAHYIFSCISRKALHARKYDGSKKNKRFHYKDNLMLPARKFEHPKKPPVA